MLDLTRPPPAPTVPRTDEVANSDQTASEDERARPAELGPRPHGAQREVFCKKIAILTIFALKFSTLKNGPKKLKVLVQVAAN